MSSVMPNGQEPRGTNTNKIVCEHCARKDGLQGWLAIPVMETSMGARTPMPDMASGVNAPPLMCSKACDKHPLSKTPNLCILHRNARIFTCQQKR